MNSEFLAKQAEMYSNAIVGFLSVQGIAFLFYYGTNTFFNCLIKMTPFLAEGIIFSLVIIAILSSIAVRYLGKVLKALSSGSEAIVQNIYRAKIAVIAIFSTIQILTIFTTAVLSNANLICA